MRKLIIYISVLLTTNILLSNNLISQEKDISENATKVRNPQYRKMERIKYNLVQEVNIGTDVCDVVFGPKQKEKSGFPTILVKDDKVLIYDDNFSFISEHPASAISVPTNQTYIGIINISSGSAERYTGRGLTEEFMLLDRRGNPLWSKKYKFHADIYTETFIVSDNGLVVGYEPYSTKINFYNREGEIIKQTKIFNETDGSRVKRTHRKISSDGQYLVILGSNVLSSVADSNENICKSVVVLFNMQGQELWRHVLDEKDAYQIAISPLGNYVIASSINHPDPEVKDCGTYIFNKNGELIQKHDGVLAWKISFSSSGKYALIDDNYAKVLLIELSSGEIMLDYEFPSGMRLFEMDISEEGKLIGLLSDTNTMGKGKPVDSRPEILIMNFNGDVIWSKFFPYTWVNKRRLKLRISEKGNEFTVRIGDNLKLFEIEY